MESKIIPVIIIPTYNEKENIKKLLKQIFLQNIENLSIIIVDDNSPDGTAQIAEGFRQNKPITIIKRTGKLGLGSAYIEGFKKAIEMSATHIFQMDADLSHDPKDLKKLLDATKNAYLSIGSRKIKSGKIIGWNYKRKLMSNGAMFFSRILLNLKTRDVTSGFRCFKTETLKKINFATVKSNGYAFQEEMLYRTEKGGLTVTEIPVTFTDRQKGRSKLSKKDILEFFSIIIKLKVKR